MFYVRTIGLTSLQKNEKQTVRSDFMVIVNNASSDGTREYLDVWKEKKASFKKIIIHNEKITGGPAGYNAVLKKHLI